MQNDDFQMVNKRLDDLERQNRRLKQILVIIPVALMSFGVVATRMTDDEIVTNGIHIRAVGEDRNRIFMGVDPETDEAVINVWDRNGRDVISLGPDGVFTKGIHISARDENANRIFLGPPANSAVSATAHQSPFC